MIDRPYVTLSCAVSLDGYLDDASPNRLLLSNPADFDRVDAVRARHDAILVGATTIRSDDPRLLIRSESRRAARVARGLPVDPTKITITGSGELDPGAAFFAAGDADKIIYATSPAATELGRTALPASVVDLGDRIDLDRLLRDLVERGIGRLLVEGGGMILTEFLARRCYDELQLAIAPIVVGDDRAPRFIRAGIGPINDHVRLAEVRRLGDIAVLRYETPTALDQSLARILAPTRALLLDFDGPVTPLLAEGRDGRIADRMRQVLAEHGVDPPAELRTTVDPLRILRWATPQHLGPDAAAAVELACIQGEVEAAQLAPLTAGAAQLLTTCQAAELPVIIVSNNSAPAIAVFLDRHGLADRVTGVIARLPGRPDLMKPDPDPIRRALVRLGRPATEGLLIGDSVTDVEVAMITGVPVIGYARPGRRPGLDLAGADVIIDDLEPLTNALTTRGSTAG
ncbi:dihydrofolate reductase family protein [Microlunatus speluncae]|uniref:dihydrofolate reductase family protein n=1 Tax=Microlunatus speluncae TaxID=2594267 RepID=UPI00126612AB|nr:dihydrofolate reductase family protein [Microlunatus speluncae]